MEEALVDNLPVFFTVRAAADTAWFNTTMTVREACFMHMRAYCARAEA